jgi:hypothetical protein
LSGKPEEAKELIKFLNSRYKDQLKTLSINDRTILVMEANKVLSKMHLLQNTERKVHELARGISSFKRIFKEVISFGLPNLWDGVGDLFLEEEYQKRLDQRRNDDKIFERMDRPLKGKDMYDMLAGDFVLLCTLRLVLKGLSPPSYEKYTDLDEISRNMKQIGISYGKCMEEVV